MTYLIRFFLNGKNIGKFEVGAVIADSCKPVKVTIVRETLKGDAIRSKIFPESGTTRRNDLGIDSDYDLKFRETAFNKIL